MLIGLHDAEKERMPKKTFPNYALMKIAAYHKSIGNEVEWFNPLNNYDQVYSSKVFDFTEENLYLPMDAIKGGTGYDVTSKLPSVIDNFQADYTIYPSCDYAIGFTTRGCVNNCSFCVVPQKEGGIRPYRKWKDLVRNDTEKLVLMDNNILASDFGREQLGELSKTEYRIDLNQGMDITLVNDNVCEILKVIKWQKYIRFSCDKDYQLPHFERVFNLFKKYKIPTSRVFIYLLVTKDLDSANKRVQGLHNICKSFNIYAQAERNALKGIMPNKEQLEFAQRYVYGRSYKKMDWNTYKSRLEGK